MRTFLVVILITVNIFFILSSPGFPADWIYAGSSKYGEKYYIDSDSIRFDGPTISFWCKTYRNGEEWRAKYSIHCEKETFTASDFQIYNSEGNLLRSSHWKDEECEWEAIPPDTVIDDFKKSLCKEW